METIEISDFTQLTSGENPNQSAYISKSDGGIEYDIISRNKELEYIDYLNLSEVVKILGEFFDVSCAIVSRNAQICSVALGSNTDEAFAKALDMATTVADRISGVLSTKGTL